MPSARMIQWMHVFELDGQKHIQAVTGIDHLDTVKRHMQQQHPDLRTIVLRPATDAEIAAEAARIRDDPNYVPLTNEELTQSARTARGFAPHPALPLPPQA